MKRREFLRLGALLPVTGWIGDVAYAAPAMGTRKLLILVELKGGNDGLNTVVPYDDSQYRKLRARLGVDRDQVHKLTNRAALHPSLEKLVPLWEAKQLAIVQGVGYSEPNLSHFRSIEIWDTASGADQYLDTGWLSRAFALSPSPAGFAADGVVVGAGGMGPLTGTGGRSIALSSPEQFLRNARLARAEGESRNAALAHILRVERDVMVSAERLHAGKKFATSFPTGPFGNAVNTAAQLAANPEGIAVIRLSLGGFDTHANQQGVHANLLRQLGDGLACLREALLEVDRWDSTVIATYSEFGRRAQENQSGGTDHGTSSAHFVLGGAVRGGMYGVSPSLARLDGNGNLPFAVDFRDYYATFLERWWGMESRSILGGRFKPLELIS